MKKKILTVERMKKKLTQSKLAKLSKVPRTRISQFELGKLHGKSFPAKTELAALAKALKFKEEPIFLLASTMPKATRHKTVKPVRFSATEFIDKVKASHEKSVAYNLRLYLSQEQAVKMVACNLPVFWEDEYGIQARIMDCRQPFFNKNVGDRYYTILTRNEALDFKVGNSYSMAYQMGDATLGMQRVTEDVMVDEEWDDEEEELAEDILERVDNQEIKTPVEILDPDFERDPIDEEDNPIIINEYKESL